MTFPFRYRRPTTVWKYPWTEHQTIKLGSMVVNDRLGKDLLDLDWSLDPMGLYFYELYVLPYWVNP